MPTRTAGRSLVAALDRAGIRHAFTVPGESFLEILDAMRDSPIRLVATRHEAGAGFMAEGYAQLTGRPAACLVTRAVGSANLSIALHTARADSAPLIAIAGQVPRPFRGREAFQEADLVATFGGLCKAAAELDDPATMARDAEALVRLASAGRPGPVLLSIPEDALLEAVADDTGAGPAGSSDGAGGDERARGDGGAGGIGRADRHGRTGGRPAAERPVDRAAVADVLRRLARAHRPVVIAGAGVLRSGAVPELVAFAEAADLPVLSSWRRTDVFPNDSPRYLGSTGLSAARTVRPRLLDADVVLVLGTRLSEIATFGYRVPAPGTEILHVDVEPGLHGDRAAPAVALAADAGAFLRCALEMLTADRDLHGPDHAARIAHDRAAYLAAAALPDAGLRGPDAPVHPATLVRALQRHLPDDAIVATDAGNFAGWAARYLRIPARGRFLGPTSGAMGYGLPAAIGAAIAARDVEGRPRRAVALAGDGGISMLMAELETAVREGVPVTAIVFDNGMYGTIRMHQERAHPGRVAATDLGRIDFARVAEACGARGLTVAHDDEAEGAVAEALAGSGVTLVHALTDPAALSVDEMLHG